MNPTYDFTGHVALVTGASSGMGAATARTFAAAGAAVVLLDRDADALTTLADELTGNGARTLALMTDVTVEAEVAHSIHRTIDEFGRLDIAFNNAGIQIPYTGIAEESPEDFERLTAVNYRGVWASMKHELRHMREQGSGTIVNSSSIGGLIGGAGRAAYHASKHAVIGLTKSAAREYGSHGVRINAICPGTIETPMVSHMIATGALTRDAATAAIPMGRFGNADEIAAAVLWLSSPGASFVTGAVLLADGGQLA